MYMYILLLSYTYIVYIHIYNIPFSIVFEIYITI